MLLYCCGVILPALLLLPLATGTDVDPVSWLVNYGVAGVVILLLVTGQLRTKTEMQACEKRLEKADTDLKERDAAIAALIQQITAHTLPQMAQMATVVDNMPRVAEAKAEERLSQKLDDLARTLAGLENRSGGEK